MANALKVHGIANCDTVKKARAWLELRGVAYEWVDFRKASPSPADLAAWARAVGWGQLLNRRGTTWRGLDDATKARVVDSSSALALMAERPALIRRPVVVRGSEVVVGFAAEDYAQRFQGRPA